jgi:lipopolysaccharide transport system permease protein
VITTTTTAGPFAELVHYRHLLWTLTWRDVRVRYKQSLLGLTWAILLPLLMTAIFAFVFSRSITLRGQDAGLPYALYALTGLAPWAFFSGGLSNCVNVLVANRNLLTKVYFPHEVFPLSCVLSAFVDFLISCAALAALMTYFDLTGQWSFSPSTALFYLPLLLFVQIVLTLGVGLMLSMANVFYRDVRQVFSVGIQLLLFVSSVVIPAPVSDSQAASLLRMNPLVPLFESYRACLLHGRPPELGAVVHASIAAVTLILVGWFAFRRLSHRFAEYV